MYGILAICYDPDVAPVAISKKFKTLTECSDEILTMLANDLQNDELGNWAYTVVKCYK